MSALVSGVVGAIVATALTALASRSRNALRGSRDGWKRLRPGWYLHGALLLCVALSILLGGVLAAGGSARKDSAAQNFATALLLLGFGSAGVYLLAIGYLRRIDWNCREIRVRAPWLRERRHLLSKIASVEVSMDGSECRLSFRNGDSLRVSGYCHGFAEFVADLGAARGGELTGGRTPDP